MPEPKYEKRPLGVGTPFSGKETLAAIFFGLSSSLFPWPNGSCVEGAEPASEKGNESGSGPQDFDRNHGGRGLRTDALLLTLLGDISVKYQYRNGFGAISKEHTFKKKQRERTRKIKMSSYLKVIRFIVVHVQSPV